MKINRKKVIICITICILIINVIVICTVRKENNPKENDNNNSSENIKQEEKSDDNKENTENTENVEKEIQITTSTQKESQISDEEKTEIIEETGKQGDYDLYEIQEGEDSVKIATIKSSVKYKVAFAGMIKNKVPEKEELDDLLEKNHPKYAGIWIKSESQSEFLKYISSVTKSKYEINENGYLKIKNKKNQNEYDKKIEEIINEVNIGRWDTYLYWAYEAFSNVQTQKSAADKVLDIITNQQYQQPAIQPQQETNNDAAK